MVTDTTHTHATHGDYTVSRQLANCYTFYTTQIMTMNSGTLTKQQSTQNGYSFEFSGKIPDELVCKMCNKVLKDPRQVVCCGQHYCQGCIEKRINSNYTCPTCRTPSFNHFRDVHFEQRINQLKIHCPHQKQGCKWTGDMTGLKNHLSAAQGCAYEGIPCPNKCGHTISRKDIKEHLGKQCIQRRVKCQYCSLENTYKVITGSHYGVCPNYPVKCPYNCGQKTVKRSELQKHEQTCPMKPVQCPFQSAGCQVKIVQKDFQEHMSTNTQYHLDMVTKSFDALRSRAESADRELRKVQAEMSEVRTREESGKKLIDRRLTAIGTNVEELIKTCTENQRFAVHSIRSLTDDSYHLQEIGQPITFQMINYSDFKRTGKIWYSSPFYVADGYKMCVAIDSNGNGVGQGSCITASLCLMRGEFDDDLNWPVELPFHLIIEILRSSDTFESGSPNEGVPPNPKAYMYFHEDTPQMRVTEGMMVEARKCENFARHDVVEEWMLFYDAVTFKVYAESEFL